MPEQLLYFLSDGDLSDIIAYLETVSPVDKEWDEPQLRPAARVLIALGAFGDVISAERRGALDRALLLRNRVRRPSTVSIW